MLDAGWPAYEGTILFYSFIFFVFKFAAPPSGFCLLLHFVYYGSTVHTLDIIVPYGPLLQLYRNIITRSRQTPTNNRLESYLCGVRIPLEKIKIRTFHSSVLKIEVIEHVRISFLSCRWYRRTKNNAGSYNDFLPIQSEAYRSILVQTMHLSHASSITPHQSR